MIPWYATLAVTAITWFAGVTVGRHLEAKERGDAFYLYGCQVCKGKGYAPNKEER